MKYLVLPWGFRFCREVFCFCREVFGFAVRYFVFAVRFSVLLWGFWFCRDSCGPPYDLLWPLSLTPKDEVVSWMLAGNILCSLANFGTLRLPKEGNFIYPMLHRFILCYQASARTWFYQFNNGGKRKRKRKRLVLPLKLSVPLLCRSIYDFRFTIPNISLVKSKRVFRRPTMS